MTGFETAIARAVRARAGLAERESTDALRLVHPGDGPDGLFVDRYGPWATAAVHEGRGAALPSDAELAGAVLDAAREQGVRGVYVKRFLRDRSRLGGVHPDALRDPTPAAGEPAPEALTVRENGCALEVRLYDGFSTGLFLDQRHTRRALAQWAAAGRPSMLNTFAYTGAFSAALARVGCETTTVDVSPRYLDWAKHNFTISGLDPDAHRFAKMDALAHLELAAKRGWRYGLIVLDPPTFSAAQKRRKIAAWSSVKHYPRLIELAAAVLEPGGRIFASTNTRELLEPGAFRALIREGLGGRHMREHELPDPPADLRGCPTLPATLWFEA